MVTYKLKENTNVKIEIQDNIKRIGIMVSGGLDSALLTYLLCKEIFEKNLSIKIKPFTWKRPYPTDHPQDWNVDKASGVLKHINTVYPGILEDQYIFIPLFSTSPLSFETEMSEWGRLKNIGYKEFAIDRFYFGTTANPSHEEMIKHDFYDGRQTKRDKEQSKSDLQRLYNPFLDVDKKGIADLYQQLGLMENLYPLTWSCEGWANSTENFTKPCGKCWWCLEKKWAFNEF
jgi:hypothetical protein